MSVDKVLETGINIKDLSVDRISRLETFSSEDVGREDLLFLMGALEGVIDRPERFIRLARNTAILFPDLDITDVDPDFEEKARGMVERSSGPDAADTAQLLTLLKFIKPDLVDISDYPEVWEKRFEFYQATIVQPNIDGVCFIDLSEMKILFPEKFSLLKYPERMRESEIRTAQLTKPGSISDALRSLTPLKIFEPKKPLPPDTNRSWWDEGREFMREKRHTDIEQFADCAASLKILAAEDIRITKEGIEIVLPGKDFKSPGQDMPQGRKF